MGADIEVRRWGYLVPEPSQAEDVPAREVFRKHPQEKPLRDRGKQQLPFKAPRSQLHYGKRGRRIIQAPVIPKGRGQSGCSVLGKQDMSTGGP